MKKLWRLSNILRRFKPRKKKSGHVFGGDILRPTPFGKDENHAFTELSRQVIVDGRTLLRESCFSTLWQGVENAVNVNGCILEVGSYRGGSSYFLAGAMLEFGIADRPLHVIDTFEGHPSFVGKEDLKYHPPRYFGDTDFDDVRGYLSPFLFAQVHKGAFEDVVVGWTGGPVAMAHVDVDTHISTGNVLNWLEKHLEPGGIVILDDYGASKCPGVRKAAYEFLENRRSEWSFVRMFSEQAILIRRG